MNKPLHEKVSNENPLYRRVFIGREGELKQLQSAFEGAVSGQGALMMVTGEPGIGKTALCEQLAEWVSQQGGHTLVGYCYEEGSRSLPYLAFIEALRPYVISREITALQKELGLGAADLARIIPEIRERLKVEPRIYNDPEEGRYQLMQAVTGFLSRAASLQPLLIILEDLHDAEKGTLDMLTHVSRHLSGTRLLIVGTYRDVEVDRAHPLSAALAELRRVSSYDRVLLRGLSVDEVRRMLESVDSQESPWGLAQAVHRQTEGNPLFVQEVIRYLHEEGLIGSEGEGWKARSGTQLAMSIPEGLRDVIGKRLSLLSKECDQLLSTAAVIGRDFRLDVLQKVSGLNDEDLFKILEEAGRAAVIEERAGVGAAVAYRFAHAFFRQTLYEENIAPRRIRLHLQVARVLEGIYSGRLEEHAAELAEHFSHSSDAADLKKAVSYGEMAAKRATDVFAYSEATRLLDQALEVQRELDPHDKVKLCDLLLGLCGTLLHVPDTRRILETEAPAAFSLAEGLSDYTRAAQACVVASFAIIIGQGPPGYQSSQFADWVERIDRYALPNTKERAWADVLLGIAKYRKGERQEAHRLISRAVDLARQPDKREAFGLAAILLLNCLQAPQDTEERRQLAEELWFILIAGSQGSLLPTISTDGLWGIGAAFLAFGNRHRIDEICSRQQALAHRTEQINDLVISGAMDGLQATLDGRLEEAVRIGEKVLADGQAAGYGLAGMYAGTASDRARVYLGAPLEDFERELRGRLPEAVEETTVKLCLVLAHLAKKNEASEILGKYVINRPGFGTAGDETPAWYDVVFLEAAVLIGHRQVAGLLLERLVSAGISIGVHMISCIPRHLGGATALLGRYDEARKHYLEAIRVCSEMRFRPELALSRLQLAELLLEHFPDEEAEALEHLGFAIKEFCDMKMQTSRERALKVAADKGLKLDSIYPRSMILEVSSGQASNILAVTPTEECSIKAGESTRVTTEQLSPREMEILRLVVAGLTNRQIAARLFISLSTAKTHVHNILEKLPAKTRTQAVSLAREFKLV